MDFGFIKDSELRKKIEDSVEFIFASYEETKQGEKSNLFKTETYRVVILYTVAIIEAVLFYIYHERGVKIEKEEYKEKLYLPESYTNTKVAQGRIQIAVVKKREKDEIEIGLHELVKFMQEQRVLRVSTGIKILEINDTRNTLHLRKMRKSACTIAEVDEALALLVYVLENAPSTTTT